MNYEKISTFFFLFVRLTSFERRSVSTQLKSSSANSQCIVAAENIRQHFVPEIILTNSVFDFGSKSRDCKLLRHTFSEFIETGACTVIFFVIVGVIIFT